MIHAEIPRAPTLRSLRRWLRGVQGTSPVVMLCLLLWRCGSSHADGLFGGDGTTPTQTDAAPLSPTPPSPAPSSASEAAAASAAPTPSAAPAEEPDSPAMQEVAVPVPPAPVSSAPVAPANPSTPADAPPGGAPMNAPPPVDPEQDDPASQEAAEPAEPAPVSTITIERARWDESDEVLEVRGEVSSPDVTLTVRFLDRTEDLVNDDGEFRAEFEDVEDQPGSLQVIASDGATVTVEVEEN